MKRKLIGIIALCILLLLVIFIQYYFFKIDKRPLLDHEEFYSLDVIPIYKELADNGPSLNYILSLFFHDTLHYPPLLNFTVASSLFFFGKSLFVLKMVNVAYFLILIVAVYLLGKELAGEAAGIFSAFLTVTMPIVINFSRKNHPFLPQAGFIVLALYFFIRSRDCAIRRYAVLCGASLGLALMIHYIGLFTSALILVFYITKGNFTRKKIINGALSLVTTLAICGPYYWRNVSHYLSAKNENNQLLIGPLNSFSPNDIVNKIFYFLKYEALLPFYFYFFMLLLPSILYYSIRGKNSSSRRILFFYLGVVFITTITMNTLFGVNLNSDSWIAFAPVMAILTASSALTLYRSYNKFGLVRIGALLGLFLVLFNGFFILFWPFAYRHSFEINTAEKKTPYAVFQELGSMLMGESLEQNLLNHVFPHRHQFDITETLVSYFASESKANNKKEIRINTHNYYSLSVTLEMNSFLRDVPIQRASQGYEYYIYFNQINETPWIPQKYHNKIKLEIHNQGVGEKKENINYCFLEGFTEDRVFDLTTHDQLYEIYKGRCYIFKKATP